MKKLSESVWMDIHKRSTGEGERQEDAFHPDYIDFGPDTTVYWAVNNLEIDGEGKLSFEDVKDYNNNGWRLPTLEEVNQVNWNNIRTPWYDHCTHLLFPDGNELKLKRESNNGFHMWASDYDPKIPSCAQSYGFDNMSKFNTDTFNINWNKLYVFLVKSKRRVNESVWMDIHKQSTGDIDRKEDDVNLLDLNGFYIYVKEHYKNNNVKYYNKYSFGINITKSITLFFKPESGESGYILLAWGRNMKIPISFFDESTDMFKISMDTFNVDNPDHARRRIITEKDGSCTNKTFINVIDFFLEHKNDLINESVWMDIHKQSTGDIERREDDVDLLDTDQMYDYMNTHYKGPNDRVFIIKLPKVVAIPVFVFGNYPDVEVIRVRLETHDGYKLVSCGCVIKKLRSFFNALSEKYKVKEVFSGSGDAWYEIYPIDGDHNDITNSFYLDVVDTFLAYNGHGVDGFEKLMEKI